MSISMTTRRWVSAGAAVLVIGGGSGLAIAQGSGGGSPAPAAGTVVNTPEPGDVPDGVGTVNEHGSEATADDDAEKAEAARLAPTVKVTRAEAQKAALAAQPGTVTEVNLGDEDGTVVWEIEVKAPNGSGHDVRVNATSGAVLSSSADAID